MFALFRGRKRDSTVANSVLFVDITNNIFKMEIRAMKRLDSSGDNWEIFGNELLPNGDRGRKLSGVYSSQSREGDLYPVDFEPDFTH